MEKNNEVSFVLPELKGFVGHSSTDALEADGVRDQGFTDGITLGEHEDEKKRNPRVEFGRTPTSKGWKKKHSSLKKELRIQPEKGRKGGRLCRQGHQGKVALKGHQYLKLHRSKMGAGKDVLDLRAGRMLGGTAPVVDRGRLHDVRAG